MRSAIGPEGTPLLVHVSNYLVYRRQSDPRQVLGIVNRNGADNSHIDSVRVSEKFRKRDEDPSLVGIFENALASGRFLGWPW